MTDTRLIIVEGLPATGKSTTASIIADELRNRGRNVVCVDEGVPDHPADYADYDFPDFETERRLILEKWREFVSQADENTVYVFNCIFLQNPMCETMMRFDLNPEKSGEYIKEIAEINKPLNPVILYISQPDVRMAVDKVLDERGEKWLNAVIGYHTEQGYGRRSGLQGYDGYIECLIERKRRELDILAGLDLESYVLSEDITAEEFKELYSLVKWSSPTEEQISVSLKNTTKSYVLRKNDKAVGMINLLGDIGMHWLLKDFIVAPQYQGRLFGKILYRIAEQYILSTIKSGWKVCVNLRSNKGKEEFYEKCGFVKSDECNGYGMEKMIEKK